MDCLANTGAPVPVDVGAVAFALLLVGAAILCGRFGAIRPGVL